MAEWQPIRTCWLTHIALIECAACSFLIVRKRGKSSIVCLGWKKHKKPDGRLREIMKGPQINDTNIVHTGMIQTHSFYLHMIIKHFFYPESAAENWSNENRLQEDRGVICCFAENALFKAGRHFFVQECRLEPCRCPAVVGTIFVSSLSQIRG